MIKQQDKLKNKDDQINFFGIFLVILGLSIALLTPKEYLNIQYNGSPLPWQGFVSGLISFSLLSIGSFLLKAYFVSMITALVASLLSLLTIINYYTGSPYEKGLAILLLMFLEVSFFMIIIAVTKITKDGIKAIKNG